MAKKVTLSPTIDAPAVDLSLITAALPAAVKGLADMATTRERARVACLAFADSVSATFGTLDVLSANARSKATDALKAGYTALKDAYFTEVWGADFFDWVKNGPDGKPRSPKRGMAAKPRQYWQQQMGNLWNKAGSGFVSQVLAFVAETKAAETPTDGKAPNRKSKALDEACRENLTSALKRIDKAVADKADIPPHVNVAAFKVLAEYALYALEKSKGKQGMADAAVKAMRAAKVIL